VKTCAGWLVGKSSDSSVSALIETRQGVSEYAAEKLETDDPPSTR